MKRGKRFLPFFVLVTVLAAVALGGCSGDKPPAGSDDTNQTSSGGSAANEITVGIAQDLEDSLDPHRMVAAGTKEVLFNIFEGLVKPDPEGNLLPAVASEYKVSENGTAYTFTLREGVLFHNRQPVTAKDVVYSIERCAGLGDFSEPLIPAFSAVRSVLEKDEQTVVIELFDRNIEFLAYLTAAIIPADYDGQDVKPVGTGPFCYVSRSPQENLVIEKFDGYWGSGAFLDRVTYKIVPPDALVMSLKSGAIDLCSHLTASQAAEAGDGFTILESTMNLVQAVYLNNLAPPFDNVKVRQALCYALNRQEVMDMIADGRGVPVGSSMYPAFGKYFVPELAERYPYNPDRARELLSEAGYAGGFSMTITVPSNYQPHIDTAQVIVEQLRAVGITATIDLVEWSTWLSETYVGRNYQSTVVGVDSSTMTARDMLERFTSASPKNFINFSDAEYDRTFAEAIACMDDVQQVALYKRLQEILSQKAANVYIQDMADLVAMKNGLTGLKFYPIYVLDLSTVRYE